MTEQKACTLCGAGGHTAAQCSWAKGERAKFEAWVIRERPGSPLHYVRDALPVDDPRYGEYCDVTLQSALEGWLACAAQAGQVQDASDLDKALEAALDEACRKSGNALPTDGPVYTISLNEIMEALRSLAAAPQPAAPTSQIPEPIRQFIESQRLCSDCHLDETCCRPLLRECKQALAADPFAKAGKALEEARRDAERYRWLQRWLIEGRPRSEIHPHGHIVQTTPEIVDAAIDAALAAAPQTKKGRE